MGRKGTLSLTTRSQIKVLLEETTMTQREIARKFNCSQSAIKNVKKMTCREQPLQSYYRGRSRITSAREDRLITRTGLQLRRQPIAEIHSKVVASGVNVSPRTVRRRMREANITAHRPAIKHKLTPIMIKKRIAWAKKYKNYGPHLWSKVGRKHFMESDYDKTRFLINYRFASLTNAPYRLATTASHSSAVDLEKDIYRIVSAKELNILHN